MENYTKEEKDSAKEVLEFYVDIFENNNSTVKYFLSENVVLDWFGKTIKDNKKVSLFLKEQACKVTHHITNTIPSEKVAFKESHNVKVPKEENLLLISSPVNTETTPPKQTQPSTSMLEIGQGDGLDNSPLMSPRKKMKFDSVEETETVEGESEISQLKYLTAEGTVEFHKPSSKKLQTETKWRRPVKLHLGYTKSSFKDCTIYLIIYESNLKCRRNLYHEFCESNSSTKPL
nr:PREDICTED: uncharacterized protein LOC103312661 [Tribolium castaneum]XP_015834884.1 PREDICTED: uncharacterized protein LOC103312661 [Tribolium castaneum]|eukprot:XP_008192085.1 PREDICTED: uncharacterized protein LOC103312661 [Tribolium castaneum]